MSTLSSKDPVNPWTQVLRAANNDESLKDDAQILMFQFLSEIEKYKEIQGINRKTLAERIRTSASYLTQLFRGDKPLNFHSLAKMQRALNIRFEIKAFPIDEEIKSETKCKNHVAYMKKGFIGSSSQ